MSSIIIIIIIIQFNLHQQLHKTNVFVKGLNGFHFFISKGEIKYLVGIGDRLNEQYGI